MKAVYFAWVRERIGKAEEELDPPAGVATVGDLIGLAVARAARAMPTRSRRLPSSGAALDRSHVKHDAKIAGAREVAFFPPMTGG